MINLFPPPRIDGDGIIKVADFGLAVEESNAKGYFRQDKSEGVRLPFKWMALESLQDGVFTAKSDVVSSRCRRRAASVAIHTVEPLIKLLCIDLTIIIRNSLPVSF